MAKINFDNCICDKCRKIFNDHENYPIRVQIIIRPFYNKETSNSREFSAIHSEFDLCPMHMNEFGEMILKFMTDDNKEASHV